MQTDNAISFHIAFDLLPLLRSGLLFVEVLRVGFHLGLGDLRLSKYFDSSFTSSVVTEGLFKKT